MNIKQDKLIQIKVSQRFKERLQKIAQFRGLPLSTYIKFVLTEYIKNEEILENIDLDFEKEAAMQKVFKKIIKQTSKRGKKMTKEEALRFLKNK